jgi:hypothetical protein
VLATDDQFWIKGAAGLKFPDGTTMITAAASGVNSPASIASGETPVYNGSTYVRSTTTRIGATSLGSGTPDSTKYLRGDGTWQVITTGPGAPATTLPGSPTNGQQAILTDSTTAPTYQWLLQYDTTISDSYKWRYIGGVPYDQTGDTNVVSGSFTDVLSFTVPRAGIYQYDFRGWADLTAGASTSVMNFIVAGVTVTTSSTVQPRNQVIFWSADTGSLAASDVIRLAIHSNGTDTAYVKSAITINPVRIA